MDKKRYNGKWYVLNFNGVLSRAKCIDIEFEGGLGPLFLMETKFGNTFWLTRGELKDHALVRNGS